ncbi:MFS transporter [Nocardioides acrostichi]|uniref:MFS transporter n=1 Tax=Nocardioides acrostichi TaxID=2784339 RepID=A0A930V0P6_9ACTN|nr:MFS transporter [Nocardioides acrostichi]MBF4161716.1 MFS transporter [Nocardioides acrostichi]
MHRTLGPLAHPDFRWLTLGATISRAGTALTVVALAFAVLDLGGSASDLGLVVGAYALTEVITTLLGGVLGDRVPRQVMLEGASVASALGHAVIAASLLGGWASLPLLAVLGMANGVFSALGGPSSQAMTPLTVPAAELSRAIAVRRISANLATIGGFSLAGLLVAWWGAGAVIALDAASYLLAALCFWRLRVPQVLPEQHTSMLSDLTVGLREVRRHAWLWLLIGQALLYHLFFGGAQGVLGPIVVGDDFGREAWGWALAALMGGFVVGGLLTLRWRPRHALFVGTVCLSLTACFPLAMAWSPTVAGVLVGAFLHGLGLEIFSVWWDTSIQQQIPPETLARVYSLDMVGSFVMRPVGLALTGPVAELVGLRTWLVVIGLVIGVSSLLTCLVPDVRNLVRREEGAEPERGAAEPITA